jgi:hypothetical protein
MGDFSIGNTQTVQRNNFQINRQLKNNAVAENTQRDTFQASNQEWKPYKPSFLSNNNVAATTQTEKVDDETVVSVDNAEVHIKKPASNDSREVRDAVLRKMGFTSSDIAAYKSRYPEGKDGLPINNGFYINNNDGKSWASKEEVAGWKTDADGNTIINVEGSSVQHLQQFRQQRVGSYASMYSAGISDPELRKQFAAEAQNLISGNGETRLEAYRRLTSVQDPQQKQQVAEALGKLAEQGGYGENPWVRLAQANYAEKKSAPLVGPGLEGQFSGGESRRLTNEALRLTQSNGQRMSREDAVFFQTQVASQLAQSGDTEGADRATRLARFYTVSDAERQKAQVFDNIAGENNLFQRGFVERLAPNTTGATSMSAPTDAQQKLDAFNRDPNNQMGMDKKDLQEDPWKTTYPDQPKLDNRNLRVSGGVGAIEEFNKWVGTYGKMQKATRIISEKRKLESAALESNRYPVPPKPEELPKFRAMLERAVGKQEAAARIAEIEQESRAFWNR